MIQHASIFTDRQDVAIASNTVRESIAVALERRRARVIDPHGLLAPSLVLCEYRRQGITFAVLPAPGTLPTDDQCSALQIAQEDGWYALAIHSPEQAEALLNAIDYQRETGR